MKFFTVLILSVLIMSGSANSWERFENVSTGLMANPYNDKEIIFISLYGGDKHAYYLDLEKRKSYKHELDDNMPLFGSSVFINSDKKLFGYYAQGEVYVYDYHDFSLKSKIVIDSDPKVTGIYTEFSNDGNQLYKFDRKNFTITVYDILFGNKTDEFDLGYQGKNIQLFNFNKNKDEFAIKVDEMMEIWSIPTKQITTKFAFTSSTKEINFRQNGDVFFYKENNSVYILNSQTGAEIFNKQFNLELNWVEFSANMKYLICDYENYTEEIFDIDKNELIKFDTAEFVDKSNITTWYITSDLSSLIGSEGMYIWCGTGDDMPGFLDVLYQYSTNPLQRTNSVSDGYISYPKRAIFSYDNELVLVNGLNDIVGIEEYNVNALLDKNGEFVDYIHVNEVPKSFTTDSKFIVFSDSTKIRFYDFLNNKFDKEYETGRNIDWNVDFTYYNTELMVIHSPDFIEVLSYDDFTPKFSIDLKSNGIINPVIRVSKEGKITICDGNDFWTVNITNGELTKKDITNYGSIQDMSDDGKYILWQFSNEIVYKYNVETDNVDYTYSFEDIPKNYGTLVKSGFWGNADFIWITYKQNTYYEYGSIIHLHDIRNNSSKSLGRYEGYPNISTSKTAPILFHGSCPFTYDIKTPEILSSIYEHQDTEKSISLYPNPSTDFITITLSNKELQPFATTDKVQIFDVLGIEVISESIHPMTASHRMNVEKLPAGVYFIRAGDKVEKFVKI